ncbi:MAG: DNA polymerase III, partial [Desulfohalobiaceae bacterium]
CQPERLDLDDVHLRAAQEAGVKVALGSDAHYADNLNLVYFGLNQAQRGWLEPGDIINTKSLQELLPLLQR